MTRTSKRIRKRVHLRDFRLSASDVRMALKNKYVEPEWAIVFEVSNATGADARRRVDAVAMNLWPSRGLALHGIEIKVSRGDWKKELLNPGKAEEVAKHCDYFWIASPVGVVPKNELPEAWGLLEVDYERHVITRKNDENTEALPVTRGFLAAVMRASNRRVDPMNLDSLISQERKKLMETFEHRVGQEVGRRTYEFKNAIKDMDRLREIVGQEPGTYLDIEHLGRALKLVMVSGVVGSYKGLDKLARDLGQMKDKLSEALLEFSSGSSG